MSVKSLLEPSLALHENIKQTYELFESFRWTRVCQSLKYRHEEKILSLYWKTHQIHKMYIKIFVISVFIFPMLPFSGFVFNAKFLFYLFLFQCQNLKSLSVLYMWVVGCVSSYHKKTTLHSVASLLGTRSLKQQSCIRSPFIFIHTV